MATQFSVQDNKPWKRIFFTIWSGQALSILGSQLVQFALIWYLTVQTGSATVLATASLVGMLPNVILGPFIGTLVDRWDRRRIMLTADSIVALATIVLAVLFALDVVDVWHIFAILFIRSLAGAFHTNAMSASTSLMVPVEQLTRIQGLNQLLGGGLNVIAAPLGALLLGVMSMQGILAIDVITALFAILPLALIQVPQPERGAANAGKTNVWTDFKEGLHYMVGWPGLLIVGLMTVGINFTIIPAFSLLPLMVRDYFGGSAIHLGWVESAMGAGMILGGVLLSIWGGFSRKILTSLIGLMGMGLGTLIIALAPASAISFAVGAALLVGFMTPMTMGPFFAIIQSTVEPDMQARVFSLQSSVGTGIVPLGLMIAGPVADRVGIHAWFLLGGILCILMAVTSLFIPAVMNMEKKGSSLPEVVDTSASQVI
ncbi:MAG TPA: MFS transporter [Anaerolineales bacterium]|nr:MFS transporter [Anaerolineales bacterium]